MTEETAESVVRVRAEGFFEDGGEFREVEGMLAAEEEGVAWIGCGWVGGEELEADVFAEGGREFIEDRRDELLIEFLTAKVGDLSGPARER